MERQTKGRTNHVPAAASCAVQKTRSRHRPNQLPRFSQQQLDLPSLGDGILGEQAMLAGVPVCSWRTGSPGAAMHAAAPLAMNCRRTAAATATGPGAATGACQHRAGVSDVTAHGSASRLA
jgi:hypothetical protein